MVKDPSDRQSVKLRRILFRKDSVVTHPPTDKVEVKKHEFHVLRMTWDQALKSIREVEKLIENDRLESILNKNDVELPKHVRNMSINNL